jgi:RND family efflux transporter MFP subunit
MQTLLKVLALALIVAAAGFGTSFVMETFASREGSAARPPADRVAVAVEVAPVERATVRDLRIFAGTLLPAARFEVAPKVGGRLERLHVDIGQAVERGQVIAELDADEHLQQVEQARAELEVAAAGVAEAESALAARQRAYERIRQLREQQVASASELDAAEAELRAQEARLRVARAQVTQREAALRAAEVRLTYTTIRASWQGEGSERVVGERFVDEGTTIAANTPIVSVLDLGELVAVIHVAERDYPRLGVGQAAGVRADPYPGERFAAEIVRLAPQFREESRQARVEVRVANPDRRLKPGMFVRVEVQLDQADDATTVPVAGLVERDGRTGVFLVEASGEAVRFVPVEVGIVEAGRAQILSPALAGEVVTLGQHLIDDGAAVSIARSRARPEAPADLVAGTGGEAGE